MLASSGEAQIASKVDWVPRSASISSVNARTLEKSCWDCEKPASAGRRACISRFALEVFSTPQMTLRALACEMSGARLEIT